jgi:hypothetical protein
MLHTNGKQGMSPDSVKFANILPIFSYNVLSILREAKSIHKNLQNWGQNETVRIVCGQNKMIAKQNHWTTIVGNQWTHENMKLEHTVMMIGR